MTVDYQSVLGLAKKLNPSEKKRLAEALMAEVNAPQAANPEPQQTISLYGYLADLNIHISEEDIDEARREMWGNVPREDI